jgi:ribonucleotide reductase alpha subunit
MEVTKRNGTREQVRFDKITQRLEALCKNVHEPYSKRPAYGHFKQSKQLRDQRAQVTGAPLLNADPVKIVQRVSVSLYDGVTTKEIDVLTAEVSESLKTLHPEYGILAARIVISNLHKSTPATLRESVRLLGPERWDKVLYERIMSDDTLCDRLEDAVDHARSYSFDYFAAKTLIRGYLLAKDGEPAERPQHMWMRVALSLQGPDGASPHLVARTLESYNLLSCGYFTHASPTLFNAGTNHQQNNSCFLLGMGEDQDSIDGIFDTLKNCALISKWGGGIGVHVHSIRSKGADIRGTNGKATGIVPMLRNFDALARYVNQVSTVMCF